MTRRESQHSVMLMILRLGDQSAVNRFTNGVALCVQTLNKLQVEMAERVRGPDTGSTSTATKAQRNNSGV